MAAKKKPVSVELPRRPWPPAVIGWREHVDLPELGIGPIIAKIDTGARSAALHAEGIELVQGGRKVRFKVPRRTSSVKRVTCELPVTDWRMVKNSGGRSELRFVIETDVSVGGVVFGAEITLTDRTDMGVPMLLGRNTLLDRFLVHPGKSFVLSKSKSGAKPKRRPG
jgi:hypothetical protein